MQIQNSSIQYVVYFNFKTDGKLPRRKKLIKLFHDLTNKFPDAETVYDYDLTRKTIHFLGVDPEKYYIPEEREESHLAASQAYIHLRVDLSLLDPSLSPEAARAASVQIIKKLILNNCYAK